MDDELIAVSLLYHDLFALIASSIRCLIPNRRYADFVTLRFNCFCEQHSFFEVSISLKNEPAPKARRLVLNPVSGRLTSRQLAGTPKTMTRRQMPRSTSSASQPHVLVTPPPIPLTDTDRTNNPSRRQQPLLKQNEKRISRRQSGLITALATRDMVLLRARPLRAARPTHPASP